MMNLWQNFNLLAIGFFGGWGMCELYARNRSNMIGIFNETVGFVLDVVLNGLILSIPFAAGYFVGRRRYRRHA